MSKKKLVLGSIIGLALLTATVTNVSAYQGGGFKKRIAPSPEEIEARQEKREAMKKAFENSDYAAWEKLMKEKVSEMQKRVDEFSQKINQENFNKLAEVQKLIEAGKYEEAK